MVVPGDGLVQSVEQGRKPSHVTPSAGRLATRQPENKVGTPGVLEKSCGNRLGLSREHGIARVADDAVEPCIIPKIWSPDGESFSKRDFDRPIEPAKVAAQPGSPVPVMSSLRTGRRGGAGRRAKPHVCLQLQIFDPVQQFFDELRVSVVSFPASLRMANSVAKTIRAWPM